MKKIGNKGIIGALISIMIAVIIGVSVTITVVNDTLAQHPEINGTTRTILNLLPVMIAVVLLVGVVSAMGFGSTGASGRKR